jgi:hypothetical protein
VRLARRAVDLGGQILVTESPRAAAAALCRAAGCPLPPHGGRATRCKERAGLHCERRRRQRREEQQKERQQVQQQEEAAAGAAAAGGGSR